MNQQNRIVLMSAFALAIGLRVKAQPLTGYCAFKVTVKSPTGSAVTGAPVAELRQNGEVYAAGATNSQGIAMLCDAPSGLIDIEVGGHLCGAVAVRYLQPYWLETRDVLLVYKNCNGEEWAPPGGCRLTLRTVDEQRQPLSGVLLDVSGGSPQGGSRISDAFGRIFRSIHYGETMTGRLVKDGYPQQEIAQSCKPGESYEAERIVVLRRR